MNDQERVEQISKDMWERLDYYFKEYEVSAYLMIWILEMIRTELIKQSSEET